MLWWTFRKLRSWDYAKRAEAIEELLRSQDARATDALVLVLVDKDTRVSTRAANALLGKGDLRGLHDLLDSKGTFLLTSKGDELRPRAAIALVARDDRVGIDALIEMLRMPDGVGVSATIQAVIDAGNRWLLAARSSRPERTSRAGPPDLPHDFRKMKARIEVWR